MKIEKLIGGIRKPSNINSIIMKGLVVLAALASQDLMAGGLDKATQTAQEIQTWLYIIVGVACTGNISYLCVMAKIGRKQWSDAVMSIGQTVFAGAAVSMGTWGYSLLA